MIGAFRIEICTRDVSGDLLTNENADFYTNFTPSDLFAIKPLVWDVFYTLSGIRGIAFVHMTPLKALELKSDAKSSHHKTT